MKYRIKDKKFSLMNLIFAYAGTLSLSKELPSAAFDDMRIGDIFIQGGNPGHAVIVVDMAKHPATGEQLFLLAQSYMPAQDIQILQKSLCFQLFQVYRGRLGTPLRW